LLELLVSLLCKAYFVRLLCTLEVLANLLWEAYFERLEFCMFNFKRLTLFVL
jgi:hypothetical protein